jgi:hypothetical protein
MSPLALSLCLVAASAEPHALQADLSAWAERSAFRLAAPSECVTEEEKLFQSQASTCWQAKSIAPQRGTKDMFPRLRISVSRFSSEAAATARMKAFRTTPKELQGEMGKTWPLRAGFRLGDRIVTVTTDAYAFEGEAYTAAAALAAALHGSELTCWARECPK